MSLHGEVSQAHLSFQLRRYLLRHAEHATISIPMQSRLSSTMCVPAITAIGIFKPTPQAPAPPKIWTVVWNTPAGNDASLDGNWDERGSVYLMYTRERTLGRPISALAVAIYATEQHPSATLNSSADLVAETGLRIWCSRESQRGAKSGHVSELCLASGGAIWLGEECTSSFDALPAQFQHVRHTINGHEADLSLQKKPLFLCLRYN